MLSWPVSSALLLPCNLAWRLRITWGSCYDNGLARLLQSDGRGVGMLGRRRYHRYHVLEWITTFQAPQGNTGSILSIRDDVNPQTWLAA